LHRQAVHKILESHAVNVTIELRSFFVRDRPFKIRRKAVGISSIVHIHRRHWRPIPLLLLVVLLQQRHQQAYTVKSHSTREELLEVVDRFLNTEVVFLGFWFAFGAVEEVEHET
jgi:hypothetical protein